MAGESLRIPADMSRADLAERAGAQAVVSARDLLILLGASDQELRDMDERDEILEREPWRKDSMGWEKLGTLLNGWELGLITGQIDWSGTRFEGF